MSDVDHAAEPPMLTGTVEMAHAVLDRLIRSVGADRQKHFLLEFCCLGYAGIAVALGTDRKDGRAFCRRLIDRDLAIGLP